MGSSRIARTLRALDRPARTREPLDMTAPITRPLVHKNIRFYLTAPAPCPYLPDQRERKVFAGLDVHDSSTLNDALTHAGFRRSQNIAYRPACDLCDACVSARVVVDHFVFHKRWARVLAKNADLSRALRPAEATDEQFRLLRSYLSARHAHGGMSDMTGQDYVSMVEESPVRTHIVEYRYTSGERKGALAAAALIDVLRDGLSLVYSFYDPSEPKRSLGAYTILDHIAQARAAGFDHVYLGYWINGSEKMGYKAQFQPLELLQRGEWRPFNRSGEGGAGTSDWPPKK
jgi:arginyl-tRNA--protein-N-Asp/Glu arginylyltransferase